MATISAGQVEALFRLRDEMSASLKNIAENTKETSKAFDGIAGAAFVFNNLRDAASSVFNFLSGAVSGVVSTVGDLVSNLLEAGGALIDTSAKTKISVEELQQFKFAAELAGGSLDEVTKAVGVMQKGIVAGDADFGKLGLSLAELREKSPAEAFKTVAIAIGEVKNPTEQAAIAMGVFGKAGADLIPMIEGGLVETMERARELGIVMSTETAAAADELGDKIDTLGAVWEGFKNNIASVIVENASLHAFLDKGIEILARWSTQIGNSKASLGDLVSNGVILFANALVRLVDVGIFVNDWLTSLRELWRGVAVVVLEGAAAIVKTAIAIGYATGAADEVLNGYDRDLSAIEKTIQAYGKASQDAIDDNTAMANKLIEVQSGLKEMAAAAEAAKGKTLDLSAGVRDGTRALADDAAALKARTEAAEAWAKAAAKYEEDVAKVREEAAQEWAAARERYDAEQLEAQINHAAAVREVILQTQEEEIKAAEEAAQKVVAAWNEFGAFADDLFDLFSSAGLESFAAVASAAAQTADMLAAAAERGYISWADLGKQIVTTFKNGSIAGGAMSGAMTGFAIGGPIGAGIGAIAGGLLGWAGKAKAAEEAMKKLRGEFLQSMGGIDALRQKAQTAGVSLDALFKAKNADALRRAIDSIKGGLDSWDEAQEKLNAAIEEYGFTIDELGPRMSAQKLEEQAGSLLEKYKLLTAAGVDHDAILARMGPDFSKYVDAAVASGQSIPESMRAIVEELFAQGKLLHENGEAYTEAEKNALTYSTTVSDRFAQMAESIERLVAALERGFNVPINFQYGSTGSPPSGGSGGHHPPMDEYDLGGTATGPDSGYPAMLHGTEHVVPDEGNHIERIGDRVAARLGRMGGRGEESITVVSHLHTTDREIALSQSSADRRREGRRDRSRG
jgi:hypothetical protein